MDALKKFIDLPMLWDIIIPVIALMIFVAILVWDSTRLPVEKRIMHRLRKGRKSHSADHS